MVSEKQLIERVRRRFRVNAGAVRVGIGDDAAVLSTGGKTDLVVTTDQFLEGVHFLRKAHPSRMVGYKALARATSDIAAMGARPLCFFLTLGLPAACTGKWFDDFLAGMSGAARRFGLVLAGGDTTKYPSIVISLTVLGRVAKGRAVLRSGARPGDLLCVSGRLGEAELGWQLTKKKRLTNPLWTELLKKHAHPEPRLALGQWLAKHGRATAVIDTSDGLSTDLRRLCRASGVGAVVWAPNVPRASVPLEFELRRLGLDPFTLALHGGEDYELLFTVPPDTPGGIPRKVGGLFLTPIGEITRGKKIVLEDALGRRTPLNPQGWDPFR